MNDIKTVTFNGKLSLDETIAWEQALNTHYKRTGEKLDKRECFRRMVRTFVAESR
jgi:hypothetical protein